MNRGSIWIGALGIALAAGATGYQLGKRSAPAETRASAMPAETRGGGARQIAPARPLPRSLHGPREIAALRTRLDAIRDPFERYQLATDHLEEWMEVDPAGALDWLRSQETSIRREDLIRVALGQFAENDPRGAAEWSRAHLDGVALKNSLIRIAEQWAMDDGQAAANWFAALPESRERAAAMEGLLFRWSGEDPRAALAWIEGRAGDGSLAAVLRYAAFAGWAKTDPAAAVAASLESSRKHGDPDQFANTLANWATMDLRASAAWLAAQVRNPAERAPALGELAGIFAHTSPRAGLEWIATLPTAEQPAVFDRLVGEWGHADPVSAAHWLATNPTQKLDPEIVGDIFHGYFATDPDAFRAWATKLPAGPLAKQAAEVVASGAIGDTEED